MLRNARTITQYDFSGGINVSQSPHLIKDNELYIDGYTLVGTQNVYWDKAGIKKRLGTTQVNATALASSTILAGVLHVSSTTGVETIVIAAWDTGASKVKFYKWSGSSWTAITDATTSITSSSAKIRMICHGDCIYIVSGLTPPKKLTSLTTMTEITVSSGVYPACVIYHKGRMWFTYGSTIFSSALESTGAGWDTTYVDAFNSGFKDGDSIQGISALADSLFVFKKNSIYRMDGDNNRNWQLVKDSNDLGSINGDTIVNIGMAIMYLGYDKHIRIYDGTDSYIVSDKIQPFLDNSAHLELASAFFDGRYYRLSLCSTGTVNNLEFLFDTETLRSRAWWINTGRAIACYFGSLDRLRNYYVDAGVAKIQQLNTGTTDNGTDITAYLQSKYMIAGSPNTTKQWDTLLIDFDSNCGDVDITVHREDSVPLSLSSLISFVDDDAYMYSSYAGTYFSDTSAIQFKKQTHRIRFPSSMDGFSLSILLTSTSSTFNFLGWTLVYKYKPI